MWRPPECRHWRDLVDLRDGVTVFASACFDRPADQLVDVDWPEVGFYLDFVGADDNAVFAWIPATL